MWFEYHLGIWFLFLKNCYFGYRVKFYLLMAQDFGILQSRYYSYLLVHDPELQKNLFDSHFFHDHVKHQIPLILQEKCDHFWIQQIWNYVHFIIALFNQVLLNFHLQGEYFNFHDHQYFLLLHQFPFLYLLLKCYRLSFHAVDFVSMTTHSHFWRLQGLWDHICFHLL